MNTQTGDDTPSRPRDFLNESRHFGRYEEVEWHPQYSAAYPEASLAAQWQHALAVYTRIALDEAGRMTHEQFAAKMGRGKQYISTRLNGQNWMSLTDAAFIQKHLGASLIAPTTRFSIPVGRRVPPM